MRRKSRSFRSKDDPLQKERMKNPEIWGRERAEEGGDGFPGEGMKKERGPRFFFCYEVSGSKKTRTLQISLLVCIYAMHTHTHTLHTHTHIACSVCVCNVRVFVRLPAPPPSTASTTLTTLTSTS